MPRIETEGERGGTADRLNGGIHLGSDSAAGSDIHQEPAQNVFEAIVAEVLDVR